MARLESVIFRPSLVVKKVSVCLTLLEKTSEVAWVVAFF